VSGAPRAARRAPLHLKALAGVKVAQSIETVARA